MVDHAGVEFPITLLQSLVFLDYRSVPSFLINICEKIHKGISHLHGQSVHFFSETVLQSENSGQSLLLSEGDFGDGEEVKVNLFFFFRIAK